MKGEYVDMHPDCQSHALYWNAYVDEGLLRDCWATRSLGRPFNVRPEKIYLPVSTVAINERRKMNSGQTSDPHSPPTSQVCQSESTDAEAKTLTRRWGGSESADDETRS